MEPNHSSAIEDHVVKPTNKASRPKLKLKVAFILVFTVIAVGGLSAIILKSIDSTGKSNSNPKNSVGTTKNLANLSPKAKNDYNQQLYDKQLASAKNNSEKSLIYSQKASNALAAKDYDNALNYAQTAEKLNPDAPSAGFIAEIALDKGDKALAKKYALLAIDRTDSKDTNRDLIIGSYQSILDKANK